MRLVRNIAILISLVIVPAMTAAQMADEVEVKEVTEKYDLGVSQRPSVSLLDLSRLDFSHSYSLSFFSGGGYSGSMGLYSGTMRYRLADPLTLTFNLGILHDPGSLFGNSSFNRSSVFLPSGYLDWRPSDNFRMSIGFETVPAYYNHRGYYYFPGRYYDWHRW